MPGRIFKPEERAMLDALLAEDDEDDDEDAGGGDQDDDDVITFQGRTYRADKGTKPADKGKGKPADPPPADPPPAGTGRRRRFQT